MRPVESSGTSAGASATVVSNSTAAEERTTNAPEAVGDIEGTAAQAKARGPETGRATMRTRSSSNRLRIQRAAAGCSTTTAGSNTRTPSPCRDVMSPMLRPQKPKLSAARGGDGISGVNQISQKAQLSIYSKQFQSLFSGFRTVQVLIFSFFFLIVCVNVFCNICHPYILDMMLRIESSDGRIMFRHRGSIR